MPNDTYSQGSGTTLDFSTSSDESYEQLSGANLDFDLVSLITKKEVISTSSNTSISILEYGRGLFSSSVSSTAVPSMSGLARSFENSDIPSSAVLEFGRDIATGLGTLSTSSNTLISLLEYSLGFETVNPKPESFVSFLEEPIFQMFIEITSNTQIDAKDLATSFEEEAISSNGLVSISGIGKVLESESIPSSTGVNILEFSKGLERAETVSSSFTDFNDIRVNNENLAVTPSSSVNLVELGRAIGAMNPIESFTVIMSNEEVLAVLIGEFSFSGSSDDENTFKGEQDEAEDLKGESDKSINLEGSAT